MLRKSPDWGRLDGSYLSQTSPMDRELQRPTGFTEAFIELWDATFTTSFFAVRQALKDITLRNFAAVREARLVTAADLRSWPPSRLTLFSDDDDWFAPDLVEHLARVAEKADGITWTATMYSGQFLRSPEILCSTNNYAVSAWADVGSRWQEAVLRHGRATRTFRTKGFRTVHLPLPLSVFNRHPASALTITQALDERPGRDGLVALLEEFNARAATAAPPDGDLSWAVEPAAATAELFSQLRPR